MGFFATIGRGWQLSKLSFSVIKADPEKDNMKYLEIFRDFKDESDEIIQINSSETTEIQSVDENEILKRMKS